MPLGVHLPDCPCARCQACASIIQRAHGRKLIRHAEAAEDAKDEPVLQSRPDPWADLRGDD
jgi:hypothetical protein